MEQKYIVAYVTRVFTYNGTSIEFRLYQVHDEEYFKQIRVCKHSSHKSLSEARNACFKASKEELRKVELILKIAEKELKRAKDDCDKVKGIKCFLQALSGEEVC